MFTLGDSGSPSPPSVKSDAELFGVPDLPTITSPLLNRPDWFVDWLSPDKRTSDFVVYAESWQAVELFAALQSQWRVNFDVMTGLDYTAVIALVSLYASRKAQRRELFEAIQAMEMGALVAFAELAERRRKDKNPP